MFNRGAAAHGDYIFGWKGDSLQQAMDKNCNLNKDCPAAGLHAQTSDAYSACTIKQQAPEPVDGCKSNCKAIESHTNKFRAPCSPTRNASHEGIDTPDDLDMQRTIKARSRGFIRKFLDSLVPRCFWMCKLL